MSDAGAQREELSRKDREYCERHGIRDLPPASMRFRVSAELGIEEFLRGGEESWATLESALGQIGRPLSGFQSALDFGCGCGRVIRSLRSRAPHLALHGIDVDAEAIEWCKRNLAGAELFLGDGLPPLPFADGGLDLVWAISVFTHLDEARQFLWLDELARAVRPGGILLATVYGRPSWESSSCFWEGASPETVREIEARGFHFANTGADESLFADVFPDWYQMTWHTREYVEREWARRWKVRLYLPRGMQGDQDLVVLER